MGRMASSSDAREKECFSDDFAERPILALIVPILVLLSASATTCPSRLGSSSRSTRSRGAPAQRAESGCRDSGGASLREHRPRRGSDWHVAHLARRIQSELIAWHTGRDEVAVN